MNGIERIAAERRRQVEQEGWSAEHDDDHTDGSLASAAAFYAAPRKTVRAEGVDVRLGTLLWPRGWLLSSKSSTRIRELEKAGALIAAEIDRLLRAAPASEEAPHDRP